MNKMGLRSKKVLRKFGIPVFTNGGIKQSLDFDDDPTSTSSEERFEKSTTNLKEIVDLNTLADEDVPQTDNSDENFLMSTTTRETVLQDERNRDLDGDETTQDKSDDEILLADTANSDDDWIGFKPEKHQSESEEVNDVTEDTNDQSDDEEETDTTIHEFKIDDNDDEDSSVPTEADESKKRDVSQKGPESEDTGRTFEDDSEESTISVGTKPSMNLDSAEVEDSHGLDSSLINTAMETSQSDDGPILRSIENILDELKSLRNTLDERMSSLSSKLFDQRIKWNRLRKTYEDSMESEESFESPVDPKSQRNEPFADRFKAFSIDPCRKAVYEQQRFLLKQSLAQMERSLAIISSVEGICQTEQEYLINSPKSMNDVTSIIQSIKGLWNMGTDEPSMDSIIEVAFALGQLKEKVANLLV